MICTRRPRITDTNLVARATATCVVVLALGIIASPFAQAQTFTTLYNFTGGATDGGAPVGQVVIDKHGDIFGTAEEGGSEGNGTVWELTSGGTIRLLHAFLYSEGAFPFAGLTPDQQGNAFGTTAYGGSATEGVAFEINTGGTFTLLYNFGSAADDPAVIYSGITLDTAGNLYGTSQMGGSDNLGTVWELSSTGSESTLYNFTGGNDGCCSYLGNLYRDSQGNLFGLAKYAGSSSCGTLFEISSSGSFSVLHTFNCADEGGYPTGNIVELNGNLYGTTNSFGNYSCEGGCGTVWQYNLTRQVLTVPHTFASTDGAYPTAGVSAGVVCQSDTTCKPALFGTAPYGGTNNWGTVWEIDSKGAFSILHDFDYSDGGVPFGPPVVDKSGDLYGTTYVGGTYGPGTIWKITP